MATDTDGACASCGSGAIVSGACCACGKGVKYMLPFRGGRRPKKPHAHTLQYEGVTSINGERRRVDQCSGCPFRRYTEIE